MKQPIHHKLLPYLFSVVGIAMITAVLVMLRDHVNQITTALSFLLIILFLATIYGSKPALAASILAMLCFNFFFLPPYYTFTIADPQNWIALFAFLVVSLTAGQLSVNAKRRAEEAERLYDELQAAFEKSSQAEAFKQSEKLKSALLDAVTHDLKTPLTSIKASVTMLIEEGKEESIHLTLDPQGREELLDVINEETDHLNDFVESMVEIAKIEAGEFHLRKTRADVEEIITYAVRRIQSRATNHRIRSEISRDASNISADSKAIAEVIYNLLDNAVKYSPGQTVIYVSAKRVEDYIEFAVEDRAKPIPPAERLKIFEKFYRSDKSAKGFGMGLAIARGIIESHNGKIWVENGKHGNRFVFELPIN